MKFKSIRTKIIFSICVLFLIVTIVMSLVSTVATYNSTLATLNTMLKQTVSVSSVAVSNEIFGIRKILEEMATSKTLTDTSVLKSEKVRFLNEKKEQYTNEYNCLVLFAGADGTDIVTNNNITDRDYFKRAMNGSPMLSEPLMRRDTGELGFAYAVPVKANNKVIGALYMVFDYSVIELIVCKSKIGETGSAYVINSTGDTVIEHDQNLVIDKWNTVKKAGQDSTLKKLAAIESKAMKGGIGIGEYEYLGTQRIGAYEPLEGTDGWSLIIAGQKNEFMDGLLSAIMLSVFFCVLIAAISVFVMYVIANGISKSIKSCVGRIELLSNGDLQSEVPTIKSSDEMGILANATTHLVSELSDVINDITFILGEMANGNLTVVSKQIYTGDFVPIQMAVKKIMHSLNTTMLDINQASHEVSAGSDQVSAGAQALSQGATEQAASVEELAATITEISRQVQGTAQNTVQASQQVDTVGAEAGESNRRMQDMLAAMSEISASSSEIGKIIKTIEDIAFQTNILALNAAVEAARAGAAGKGFAVVADEVRNLASKSAVASKSTAALIEGSLKAVGSGTKIADETAQSLSKVVSGVHDVTLTIEKISDASKEQAQAINQVTTGVDQISAVVQTNSATAEESAAASEELSGQASMLKSLVGKFRLEEESRFS